MSSYVIPLEAQLAEAKELIKNLRCDMYFLEQREKRLKKELKELRKANEAIYGAPEDPEVCESCQ